MKKSQSASPTVDRLSGASMVLIYSRLPNASPAETKPIRRIGHY
jgi:hypothetical protein